MSAVHPSTNAGYPPAPPGYPPAPPGYPPAPPAYPPAPATYTQPGTVPPPGNTVVLVNQPMGPQPGATVRYREIPVRIICQHCGAEVITTTEYTIGTLVWIVALVLCLFGLFLGCCLIPCCVSSLKDVVHTCPNCKQKVGHFNRLS